MAGRGLEPRDRRAAGQAPAEPGRGVGGEGRGPTRGPRADPVEVPSL